MSSEIINHSKKTFLPAAGHDLFLPLYDPLISLLGGDRAKRDLIAQANITSGQRILDIGCGTGTLAVMLKRSHAGVEVVGLDPDPKALRRAKTKTRRAGLSLQLDQGFADELPYAEDSFDRVFSSFMFHHLEEQDRERTLSEVARVLKPGGSFHLLDFTGHEHGSHGFLKRLVNSHAQLKDNSDARILQLLKQAGFSNAEKVKESQMLLGLLRTAYYRARV
ncbi:MAG TPA: class I SAM-dependent methyltransferase [Pyrinomonadaceae bacterium]|nr:class I SAM-dependent methyltransferase [Pyrinomonadaceae bacterium]